MSAAGDHEAGVTLLEALVVIAIVAMVSALVVPNMERSLGLLSLRESVGVVQADLRVARGTALRTGTRVSITPLPDKHGYDWIGGTRHLSSKVSLNMSGPISFYGDGSMIPAAFSLTSGSRRININVDATTGTITAGGR